MNLDYCSIARVENGWILRQSPDGASWTQKTFVFTTSSALAKFIADNFFIPKEEKKTN